MGITQRCPSDTRGTATASRTRCGAWVIVLCLASCSATDGRADLRGAGDGLASVSSVAEGEDRARVVRSDTSTPTRPSGVSTGSTSAHSTPSTEQVARVSSSDEEKAKQLAALHARMQASAEARAQAEELRKTRADAARRAKAETDRNAREAEEARKAAETKRREEAEAKAAREKASREQRAAEEKIQADKRRLQAEAERKEVARQEEVRQSVTFVADIQTNAFAMADHLRAISLLLSMVDPTDELWLQTLTSELESTQRTINVVKKLEPTERFKGTYTTYMKGMAEFEKVTTGLRGAIERQDLNALESYTEAMRRGQLFVAQASNEMTAAAGL